MRKLRRDTDVSRGTPQAGVQSTFFKLIPSASTVGLPFAVQSRGFFEIRDMIDERNLIALLSAVSSLLLTCGTS